MAFDHISGAEPSTVTFKAATISMLRNSSKMHQEIISIGDRVSSLGIAVVTDTDPDSTAFGLAVRIAGAPTVAAVIIGGSVNQGTPNAGGADAWPVTVSGSLTVIANGPIVSGAGDVGAAPVKIGGIVHAPNPSTVADGQITDGWFDPWGRLHTLISSTAADNPVLATINGTPNVRPVFSSTNTDNPVRAFLSSTAADNPVLALATASTPTLANVNASGTAGTAVTLQALNAARRGWVCYNDSAVALYVKFGTSASTSSFSYYLSAQQTLELPSGITIYTGVISGVFGSTSGTARVTELTA